MRIENRKGARRTSDTLIHEAIQLHQLIQHILEGKRGDLEGALRQLRNTSTRLGRREKDEAAISSFCAGLEKISESLEKLGVIEQLPRKVSLRKKKGRYLNLFPLGTEVVGWEKDPPRLGNKYFLYLDNGRLFRTSTVLSLGGECLHTVNSHYQLQVLKVMHIGRNESSAN